MPNNMRGNTPPHIQDIEEDADGQFLIAPEDEEFEEVIALEDASQPDDNEEMGEEEEEDDGLFSSSSPVPDHAILTFRRHKAPVFTCSLHPSKDWAVTGSEDDKAYVWNTQTGEVIQTIEGHSDTVIDAHFSHDGGYLATGDMSGEIQVFKVTNEVKKVWEYSMGDMCWMKWHRGTNVLLAASDQGDIYIWRIPSGDCKILPGNAEKCESAELTGDGKKIFAGYGRGTLKLWDIKSSSILMEVNQSHPMAHKENVATVSCDKDSPLFMSGGEDGKIVFCTNNGPVGTVEASGPVECVAFSPSPDFKVAASGTLHGQIAIWDYGKYTMRTLCEHPEMDDGVTIMKWISDYTLLVGTIQGHIFGYDARSGVRKFELSGHLGDIYAMEYNPREGTVISVAEDQSAKIFKCPDLGD